MLARLDREAVCKNYCVQNLLMTESAPTAAIVPSMTQYFRFTSELRTNQILDDLLCIFSNDELWVVEW